MIYKFIIIFITIIYQKMHTNAEFKGWIKSKDSLRSLLVDHFAIRYRQGYYYIYFNNIIII